MSNPVSKIFDVENLIILGCLPIVQRRQTIGRREREHRWRDKRRDRWQVIWRDRWKDRWRDSRRDKVAE
jgi:hypothetical protein